MGFRYNSYYTRELPVRTTLESTCVVLYVNISQPAIFSSVCESSLATLPLSNFDLRLMDIEKSRHSESDLMRLGKYYTQ